MKFLGVPPEADSGVSAAAGLKRGQFNRKRDFDFAEFIKKRISNHE